MKEKKLKEKQLKKIKMDLTDAKLAIINLATLAISFTDIEVILKICLLTVSIGYTITKWKEIYKNGKNK